MKRTLATTIFFILYSLFIHSADTIQLNLSPLVDTYTQTEAGYWEDTYLDGVQIEDEMFRFAHTGSSDGGGGMAYWEGFTLCSSVQRAVPKVGSSTSGVVWPAAEQTVRATP